MVTITIPITIAITSLERHEALDPKPSLEPSKGHININIQYWDTSTGMKMAGRSWAVGLEPIDRELG